MRVTCDEYVGLGALYQADGPGRVAARISAYVRDEHAFLLALETCGLPERAARHAAVDIAVYAAQGFECRYAVGEFERSEVARMPYFVYILQESAQFVVEGAVRV